MIFFKIAEEISKLEKPSTDEIKLRTTTNRLYYGIYHLIIQTCGINIPANQTTKCHTYVKNQITNRNLTIKRDYENLEKYRVDADYYIESVFDEKDYKDALKIKEKIRIILLGKANLQYLNDEEIFTKYKSDKE
ncbi:MAG: hypothetical protein ACTSVY_07140 [Candidatus Helarchaeota archaeon]